MNPLIDPLPLTQRTVSLLKATERGLADGIAPLGHEFLCDNSVTLDEAYALADTIRTAIQVFRVAPASVVGMAIADAAVSEATA